jgi:ubiquinone/menaquinone biosynthesis C-methylase UbiE
MRWFGFGRHRQRGAGDGVVDGSFRLFGGRRYAAGVPYALPKDDREINRLDFQHYMLRFALRGNYLAPIGQPDAILDVGCGSGRWPREMAAQFPRANVVGLDVTPPPADQGPGPDVRPPNYVFVAGNILEGLPFGDASFDFVHQRLLIAALPADRWPGVIQELRRVTRPGGWVELVEGDLKVEHGGPALDSLAGWGYAAAARRGIQLGLSRQIGRMLQEGGLSGVVQRETHQPIGQRHGRLGTMMESNHFALFENLRGLVLGAGLTTAESYDGAVRAARTELARGRCTGAVTIAYGRRVA